MRTAMIDTMIFDALAADAPGRAAVLAAIRARRLRLLTTHVQEHQLAEIRDHAKRKRLQQLPREVVPSAVPVVGVSRRGHARLRDAAGWHGPHPGDRHAKDSVIAAAAVERADVLVTEDRRLLEDARGRGITVWTTADLVAWAACAASD